MDIGYLAPLQRAWARMKGILFNPSDLGKWLMIGFSGLARTARRGGGGGGTRLNLGRDHTATFLDVRMFLRRAWEYLPAHPHWLALIIVGAVVWSRRSASCSCGSRRVASSSSSTTWSTIARGSQSRGGASRSSATPCSSGGSVTCSPAWLDWGLGIGRLGERGRVLRIHVRQRSQPPRSRCCPASPRFCWASRAPMSRCFSTALSCR